MRKIWTNDETELLTRLYPGTSIKVLADRFCCSMRVIYSKAKRLGLRKSEECFNSAGVAGRFRPGDGRRAGEFKQGHRPHNFGVKGWQAGGNSVKTQFKKGNIPQTWVPVGSERIGKDGILQIKISDTGYGPRDWKSAHSILWESCFGPVPPGHLIIFKDGIRKNIFIDNLELVSRAENMRRNSIHHLPPALADVCRIKGVLNRHINKRKKQDEK